MKGSEGITPKVAHSSGFCPEWRGVFEIARHFGQGSCRAGLLESVGAVILGVLFTEKNIHYK